MTIAAITTFGFITGSTVSLAVTLGYGAGAPPPIVTTADTHDLPIRRADIKRWKEKQRADREKYARLEAEKLAEASDIRREIDNILNPPPARAAETAVEAKKPWIQPDLPVIPPVLTKKQQLRIEALTRQIKMLLAEAELMAEQQRLIKAQERRQKDNEDMEVINALLDAPGAEIRSKMFHVKH